MNKATYLIIILNVLPQYHVFKIHTTVPEGTLTMNYYLQLFLFLFKGHHVEENFPCLANGNTL